MDAKLRKTRILIKKKATCVNRYRYIYKAILETIIYYYHSMKTAILTSILLFLFRITILAQFPGCPDINAGADQVLPCSQNCTNITATPFQTGATNTYSVSGIPHTPPIAYNAPGGTAVSVGTDDVWSPITVLPFNFCYFGNTYNSVNIGSNGSIQFGPAVGGGFNPWSYNVNAPSGTLTAAGDVFGPYHDIDPSLGGTVKWYLLGTAPCRIYAVVFNNVPMFSCTTVSASHMIVIYETTNVIDVFIKEKPICAGWNQGNAIVGIQNPAGTVGFMAPGRTIAPDWAVTNATSEGWRFTPNGAPNYSVSWYDGATLLGTSAPGASGPFTLNVCPGGPKTYEARVTYTLCNGTQITDIDQMNVSYTTLSPAVVTTTAETCAGANNGIANINNPSGSGPFTVTISGPSSASIVEPNTSAGSANFTGLPDGAYTFNVTGSNGCTTSGSFNIAPGGTCCSVTASNTPVLCNGSNTGTVTANPTGVAPFTYSWTGGQTSQTANNLTAGTYTVTLTDNTGCVTTANTTVTQPATAVSASSSGVNVTCNGACNGSITITASNGTPGYQYSLNGGAFQVSNVFNGLCAGVYTITVRDANNCTVVINRTITQPTTLSLAVSTTVNATCGAPNGSITLTGSGGTAAYQFNRGGANQASPIFTGLAPGTYTFNIIDALGCTTSVSGTISAVGAPNASIASILNVSCNGGTNGSVLVNGSGGVGALTYSLNNNVTTQASNSFSALSAGSYTVTVTDANLCQVQVPFTIIQPTALTFSQVVTNVSCNGLCNGQIIATPAGGTAPYTYSSNAGSTYQASSTLGSLCPGSYVIVVKDDRGCLNNSNVTITQPAPISATFVKTNPICNNQCNGTITVTASGGTPVYNYSINSGPNQLSNVILNGCGGANLVTVTDANGCTFNSTQNLVDPPAFTISEVIVESNCGFNNGSITATLNSPNAPINYFFESNPTPFPVGFFNNLFGGAYLVTAVDALGCSTAEFMGVSDIEMSGIVVSQLNATCFGSDDGAIAVTNLSGANPISFLLDTSLVTTAAGAYTTLPIGPHVVTIIDGGNCVFTLPFTITEPDSIIFENAVVNVTCNSGNNGQITISNPQGGNGAYTYSLNGGLPQISPVFTGLTVGSYTVRVIDGNGCESSLIIPVTENPAIVPLVNPFNLNCNNDNSGYVQLGATGGGGTYDYSLDGILFTSTPGFVSLSAGAYTVTVQDQFGCFDTSNFNITEPAPLSAAFVPSPALCNGVCNGSVLVNAIGGTGPYQFSADNGVSFFSVNTINGLCDGTAQMVVKDNNNCTFNGNAIITEPTPLTFTTALVNETCSLDNGSITITANGATPAYEYSVNAGAFQTGNSFTSLNAGSYNLTVRDDNNCSLTSVEVLQDLTSPVIIGVTPTNILCNSSCNGALSINANGGTGSLDFNIGGANQVSSNFSALCANTYTVTVTDDNGCTDSETINITQPTPLTFTQVVTNTLCFDDNNGSIDFNATGGVGPYQYSTDNGVTFGNSDLVQFLGAGTYNLIVKDANNCTSAGLATVTEPQELILTLPTEIDVLCNGALTGQASIVPIGGTVAGAYQFTWTNTLSSTSTATGLSAGGYSVEVEDDNGCQATESFNITEPPVLIISTIATINTSCNGVCDGEITVTSPLATQFSADNGATFQAGNNFMNLCDGNYTVVVQDANACQTSQLITISEPLPLVLNAIPEDGDFICYNGDGQLSTNANGGTLPYTFIWEGVDSTQFLNVNLTAPQTFSVIVIDANGCTTPAQNATINVYPPYVPNATSNVNVCPGQPAALLGSGSGGVSPYSFQWLSMDLDTVSSTANYSYVPTSSNDTMMFVSWDACYQYDTLYVPIVVFDVVAPNLSALPARGCSPLTTVLSIVGDQSTISSVAWNFGDGTSLSGDGSESHTYVPVGTYDVGVVITTIDGCTTDTVVNNLVTVAADPIADFSWNPLNPTVVQSTVSLTNQSVNAVSYNWDFFSFGGSTLENPSVNFANIEPGEIQVCLEVESIDGCIHDTCKMIPIVDEFILYVPNSFTPDGDEYNNIFKPVVTDGIVVREYLMIIFDRWGEVIFESKNIEIGWDGTYHDQYVKEGAYVWKIIAKINDNAKSKEYVGHINVLK
jgi:large repetitive protein